WRNIAGKDEAICGRDDVDVFGDLAGSRHFLDLDVAHTEVAQAVGAGRGAGGILCGRGCVLEAAWRSLVGGEETTFDREKVRRVDHSEVLILLDVVADRVTLG